MFDAARTAALSVRYRTQVVSRLTRHIGLAIIWGAILRQGERHEGDAYGCRRMEESLSSRDSRDGLVEDRRAHPGSRFCNKSETSRIFPQPWRNAEENQAIADAVNGLTVLRREVAEHTQKQIPQKNSNAI
jgi:hypothetical protein